MKNLFLLILFLSFSFAFSDTCDTEPGKDDPTLADCIKMNTLPEYDACCLLTWKYNGDSGKSCFSITNEEVTNRDNAFKRLQKDFPNSTGTIVCKGEKEDNNSSFLKISLFYLLVLFL